MLRWPLPALMAWAGSWLVYGFLQRAGVTLWLALSVATVVGALLSVLAGTFWRHIAVAAGFPLSLLL